MPTSLHDTATLFTKRNAGSARLNFFWGRVYITEPDIMYHLHSVPGKNLAKTLFQNFSPFSHSLEISKYTSHPKIHKTVILQLVWNLHLF